MYREASRRGVELAKTGQIDKAMDAFAEMMSGRKEDQLFSYLQRADLLEELGRYEESLALYRLATALAPEWDLLGVGVYTSLLRCGRFDEAVEHAKSFFAGRLELPHPDPVVEGHRQNIVRLLNMNEEAYSRTRQRLLEDPVSCLAEGGPPL